jgi:hypothetical protein
VEYFDVGWLRRGRLVGLTVVAVVVLSSLGLVSASGALPSVCSQTGQVVSCGYGYTGSEQTFSVPANVTSVSIAAVGGAGGAVGMESGGVGGTASAELAVSSGETLYVEVGGAGQSGANGGAGGWGGGGAGGVGDSGTGGGGGGASDVRTVSCGPTCPGGTDSLSSRVLVFSWRRAVAVRVRLARTPPGARGALPL